MVEVKETVAHAVCIARPLTDLFLIASHSRQSVVDIAMMDREMERESLVGQDYQRDRRDERCKIVLSYAWIGCRACLFVLSMVVVVRELRTNRGTSTMDGVVRHATKGADANVSLSDADGKVKGMLGCNHLNLKVFPYGTYCGPLIDGVPDTRNNSAWQGTMWYSGGSQYEGQWKNGNMNGWGQLKASNGDVYSGHFRDGMKDGRFDFTQQSGEKRDLSNTRTTRSYDRLPGQASASLGASLPLFGTSFTLSARPSWTSPSSLGRASGGPVASGFPAALLSLWLPFA